MTIRVANIFMLSAVFILSYASTDAAVINIFSERSAFEMELGSSIVDDYSNPDYSTRMTDAEMSAVLGETKYTATQLDVSRGPWKKNGALHSVIRVSDQAATSACSRTSLRRW